MRHLYCLLFVLFSSLAANKVYSQSVELDDLIFYEIGGASAYGRPLGFSRHETLRLSTEASVSLNCNGFDLNANLQQLFDEFASLDDQFANLVSSFAGSIISSLPLLILREVNPNLADLLENYSARYEELIRISVADCQQIQDTISESDSLYSGWSKVARGAAWTEGLRTGQTATDTQQAADRGVDIVWLEGQRAGITDDISVVNDLVTYGYTSLSATSNGEPSPISTIFPSADAATEYANRVVGEMIINLSTGSQSVAGTGVLPEVRTTEIEVLEVLTGLIGRENATAQELSDASSSYVRVTGAVMDAIRNQPRGARQIFLARLASEIAVSREYEKLNAIRRSLVTAKREPNVLNTPAVNFVNAELLPDIDYELELLLRQSEISDRFVSRTSMNLLRESALKRTQVSPAPTYQNEQQTIEGFPAATQEEQQDGR